MKTIFAASLLVTGIMNSQAPKVSDGKIEHFESFKSQYVDPRNIDVWLPADYSAKEKYAVVYMQDGQSLFDAGIAWNNQSWELGKTAAELNTEAKGMPKKFIIVGIWNNGVKRHAEYFPQKPYNKLTDKQKEFVSDNLFKSSNINPPFVPNSDNYLKFLVNELKPFIDSRFSTLPDRDNTCIAGSSMGGLISLYAICEYPEVFGAAACMSTHWTGIFQLEDNPVPGVFFDYMRTYLPDPRSHRIYFDYGDQSLDALYFSLQLTANDIMREKGYSNVNWETHLFPGKDHSEKSWAERVHIPLKFLFKR
ncbi:MAG: alpha/beta hydrolase-fold protein [Flavobacterium sp.]